MKQLWRICLVAAALLGIAVFLFYWTGAHLMFGEVDRCLDAGGRWVAEVEACECTYAQRGSYDPNITEAEYAACRIDLDEVDEPHSR